MSIENRTDTEVGNLLIYLSTVDSASENLINIVALALWAMPALCQAHGYSASFIGYLMNTIRFPLKQVFK